MTIVEVYNVLNERIFSHHQVLFGCWKTWEAAGRDAPGMLDFTLSLKGLRRGEIWKDKWNCLMLIAHAWLPGQGDDGPEEGRSRCSQRQAWRSGIPMWKWFRNWIPKLMLRLLNRGQRLANWRQNWRFQDRSAEWRHFNPGHVEYNCGSWHELPMQMQCLLADEDASKCVLQGSGGVANANVAARREINAKIRLNKILLRCKLDKILMASDIGLDESKSICEKS